MLDLKDYYITWGNPFVRFFKNIKVFFKNVSRKRQRAKKGYCTSDLVDLDLYLSELIPAMLREFAEKTDSWPDHINGIKSYEDWQLTLIKIAELFEKSQVDYPDNANKFLDDMCKVQIRRSDDHQVDFNRPYTAEDQKIVDKYKSEEEKIWKQRIKCRKQALTMLMKYWNDLCI